MPIKTEEESKTIDPNRTPFSAQQKVWDYVPHPLGPNGFLKVDHGTKEVQAIQGIGFPIYLPESLRGVPQPKVHTCSRPGPQNLGCWAASGCPIFEHWPHNQPCNVIIMKDGKRNSVRCFQAYTGITASGFPTSQAHYLMDGFEVVTNATTITETVVESAMVDGVRRTREYQRETEVPELAPFYDKIKAEQANPPKKRGRPKKDANREDQPPA